MAALCCSYRQFGSGTHSTPGRRLWGQGWHPDGVTTRRVLLLGEKAASPSAPLPSYRLCFNAKKLRGADGVRAADVFCGETLCMWKPQTGGWPKMRMNVIPSGPCSLRNLGAAAFSAIPHFASDLWARGPEKTDGKFIAEHYEDSELGVTSDRAGVAQGAPLWPPVDSSDVEADEDEYAENTVYATKSPDLQRLQHRYDLLLRNPQALGAQVQLLCALIQKAQRRECARPYMRQLRLLQERIRTPGTDACLVIKPVVYAAFCIYCPSKIQIAAAKRVGAADHLLRQHLKFKSLKWARRDSGAGRADQWLGEASLQNLCVYPLEALSPQLRLFPFAAPERLAAWQETLGKGLAF